MNRTLSIVLFLAGVVLFLFFVIGRLQKNKSQFENKEEKSAGTDIRYVKAIRVQNDSVPVYIEAQGRISSARRVDVSSEVQGYLLSGSKILKPGMNFRQGEILFHIRDTEAKLALQARKSVFINIISNAIPDIRLEFPENASKWNNYLEQTDISKPLPDLPVPGSAREKTFLASKNIFNEYYTIRAEEERLKKYTITAPFNGSVTEVFAEPGSVVNPGVKLISIIKSDDLELEVPVDIRNIGWLKTGQKAELTPTTGPSHFTGKIVRIGEYVSASTQSIPVFISIDKKPEDILYNGMYLEAKIHTGSIPEAVEIPRRSLVNENSFYIWKDSSLVMKEARIEFVTKNSFIISGVKNGSVIVTEPVTNFNDSAKYSPILPE